MNRAWPRGIVPGHRLPLAAGPGLFLVGSLVFKASVLHAQWRQRLLAVVAVFGVTASGAFVPALAAWSLVLVVLGAFLAT